MKRQDEVKQSVEEYELIKAAKLQAEQYYQNTLAKLEEQIKNHTKTIENIEKTNNYLVLKSKELEEKNKEYESILSFQEGKIKELQSSEQKSQIKSSYFSAQNSFVSSGKSPKKDSTLKSQLKNADSEIFEYHNVEFQDKERKAQEIQTEPVHFEASQNEKKIEVEREQLKEEIERLKGEIEKMKLEMNKLKTEDNKIKVESIEMKDYNKRLSEELNQLRQVHFLRKRNVGGGGVWG